MKRRLGVVRKAMSHARDVAAAELAEVQDCRKLLCGGAEALEVNRKITEDLRTLLQVEKAAEGDLRRRIQDVGSQIADSQGRSAELVAQEAALQNSCRCAARDLQVSCERMTRLEAAARWYDSFVLLTRGL